MTVHESVFHMKQASPVLASSSVELRNRALAAAASALDAHQAEIFEANHADCKAAEEAGIKASVMKRLLFNEHKLSDCLKGIQDLIAMPDPLGRTLLERELDEGLTLRRVSVPIGVVGIIFEARPDALIQISSLCIKSGNCAVLKGGKETERTNRVLFQIIHDAVVSADLPDECLLQVSAHSEIDELLTCSDCVDLLIPRGSNAFVRHIMDNTKIPVMGHSDGICATYVDEDADFEKSVPIIVDAKCQYPAACNATETLLVHRRIAQDFLPLAARALEANGVRLRGTREVKSILPEISDSDIMEEADFRTEYLDLILSIRLVDSVEEACAHINRYGSHHTDAILTENAAHAETFMSLVDSAGVYQNCSTRFADGYRYGFGAEVGISTGKLHARGPVGLEGLTTYKYRLTGSGQIVSDYAEGRKQFHFRDL